ncbi:MAG: hypothetical protein K940chlam7_00350 [Chlamydiae bacterium]|nr:hypothetical protein [Chlamydiota bacterium]
MSIIGYALVMLLLLYFRTILPSTPTYTIYFLFFHFSHKSLCARWLNYATKPIAVPAPFIPFY